jgi:hypothetical protein
MNLHPIKNIEIQKGRISHSKSFPHSMTCILENRKYLQWIGLSLGYAIIWPCNLFKSKRTSFCIKLWSSSWQYSYQQPITKKTWAMLIQMLEKKVEFMVIGSISVINSQLGYNGFYTIGWIMTIFVSKLQNYQKWRPYLVYWRCGIWP